METNYWWKPEESPRPAPGQAVYVGPVTYNPFIWRGDARVYKVGGEFIVVSAGSDYYGVPYTLIFRSDCEGNVSSWEELPGSIKGRADHELALLYAGYGPVV